MCLLVAVAWTHTYTYTILVGLYGKCIVNVHVYEWYLWMLLVLFFDWTISHSLLLLLLEAMSDTLLSMSYKDKY